MPKLACRSWIRLQIVPYSYRVTTFWQAWICVVLTLPVWVERFTTAVNGDGMKLLIRFNVLLLPSCQLLFWKRKERDKERRSEWRVSYLNNNKTLRNVTHRSRHLYRYGKCTLNGISSAREKRREAFGESKMLSRRRRRHHRNPGSFSAIRRWFSWSRRQAR